MRVQEPSDLSSKGRGIQQLAHVAGIVEQLSLLLSRQCIPLHNNRGSKTSQDRILLGSESDKL